MAQNQHEVQEVDEDFVADLVSSMDNDLASSNALEGDETIDQMDQFIDDEETPRLDDDSSPLDPMEADDEAYELIVGFPSDPEDEDDEPIAASRGKGKKKAKGDKRSKSAVDDGTRNWFDFDFTWMDPVINPPDQEQTRYAMIAEAKKTSKIEGVNVLNDVRQLQAVMAAYLGFRCINAFHTWIYNEGE
jgi:hypothetical protein